MDVGITEEDFWNMTYGEIRRAIEAYNRRNKVKLQQQASMDYVLADLIGRSIARIHSSRAQLPEIASAYPTLFDAQEIQEKKEEKVAELSALRFRMFAESFNKRFKEVGES